MCTLHLNSNCTRINTYRYRINVIYLTEMDTGKISGKGFEKIRINIQVHDYRGGSFKLFQPFLNKV